MFNNATLHFGMFAVFSINCNGNGTKRSPFVKDRTGDKNSLLEFGTREKSKLGVVE
jgi:hypothetical protein